MGDRRDYYFRQKVTEAELDAGFDGLEQADFNFSVDHGLIGIVEGMAVSEKSGTPDLTVDASGPGQAYSKQGERIAFSSLQNVDLSVDDGAVSTAVAAPGNARIVSLFITFDRLLSDPRIDGNSATVFHLRDESFVFSVVAGAEALSGSEVPPPVDVNKILLADITLIFGQTQIFNADIDVASPTRREDAFAFAGSTPVSLIAGTPNAAVSALLVALNNHLAAVANKHPGADVTYAGSPNWQSGNPLTGPPANVEAGIDAVVSDLARLTGGIGSGAEQIGIDALPNWHDGVTQPPTALFGRLTAVINALVATAGGGGADKLGAGAQTSGGESVAIGSIFDQIGELLVALDGKADLAGDTFTGDILFTPAAPNGIRRTSGGDDLPIIHDTRDPGNAIDFVLLYRGSEYGSGATGDIRLYKKGETGFVVTLNAGWDGTQWVADNDAHAWKWEYVVGVLSLERRTGALIATPWDDASWTSIPYLVAPGTAGQATPEASLSLRDGILQFPNAQAAQGSNLANGTQAVANALYAKNVPKAWLKAFGQSLVDESFNITSIAASGLGSIVTYARSAPSFTDNSQVATCDGTSDVSATFLTCSALAVNGCTVRGWVWTNAGGGTITEEDLTSNNWSLHLHGRHI